VRQPLVARHAREFDRDLARRPAGSQEEEAAAAYLLAHLQHSGYVARLEPVPVANTVNSTDVIALPPSGRDPEVVVAVPYDTAQQAAPGGAALGLFLELARALRVADPRHSVEFVALGAERTPVQGGHLGARRLAQLLIDEDRDPLVVTLEAIYLRGLDGFGAFGANVDGLTAVARGLEVPVHPLPPAEPEVGEERSERALVFRDAGLSHVAVTGRSQDVGRVLVAYLRA
jgi:hypothetical protein